MDNRERQPGQALHAAIAGGQWIAAFDLARAAGALMLSARNRAGCTPLMLASMMSKPSLIELLLERGAAETISTRSEPKRTAADYAEEHAAPGSPMVAVAARFRALEQEALQYLRRATTARNGAAFVAPCCPRPLGSRTWSGE